jgi:hypothetical protein
MQGAVAGWIFLFCSALDLSGIDFGSILVRYLQDYPNRNLSPLERLISTDYYVAQGNM